MQPNSGGMVALFSFGNSALSLGSASFVLDFEAFDLVFYRRLEVFCGGKNGYVFCLFKDFCLCVSYALLE